MRSSHCHRHAVTDSRGSLPPSHGAGRDSGPSILPLLSLQSRLLKVRLSWRCYGHILSLHMHGRPQKGRKVCKLSIPWIRLILSHLCIFTVLKINELSAHLLKHLLAHLTGFLHKALAEETLHRRLTPHRGGFRVQLANKIKAGRSWNAAAIKAGGQSATPTEGVRRGGQRNRWHVYINRLKEGLCFRAAWILLSRRNWKRFWWDGQSKVCGLEIDFSPLKLIRTEVCGLIFSFN